MNTIRNVKATIDRIVVVLDLPRFPADGPERAVLVDGIFRRHSEVIEVDASTGLSLIHSGRARPATPEEAAGEVIIAKTQSKGSILSNDFSDEESA